jgi:hypothetical protein
MAINFGGVIAGIDKEWTRQIESKDRKEERAIDRAAGVDDAMKLADYRQKLGVEDSNRTERKELETWASDTAGTLKAMGASDSQIKAIVAAGKGAGNQVIESVKLGFTNYGSSFKPNALFDVFGTEAKNVNDAVTSMPSNTEKVLSASGNTFFQAMGDAYGTPDKEYTSLTAFHAGIVQKIMSETDPDELKKLQAKEKILLEKINSVDTGNSERKFNFSDINKIATRYRKERLSKFDIKVGLEGELQQELGGQQGIYHIAEAEAISDLEIFNSGFKTPDIFLTGEIDRKKDTIKNSLNAFAVSIVNSKTYDEVAETYGFDKGPVASSEELTSNINKGMYGPSDIISYGGSTYIYVGYDSFLTQKIGEGLFPFHKVEFN